jgi:hypothetical protein
VPLQYAGPDEIIIKGNMGIIPGQHFKIIAKSASIIATPAK